MNMDKKEQRKEQHRTEILQAAEQIFARQGFHKTTMDEVAEACGWSKGTLYSYFTNKEELFFSVLIEKLDVSAQALDKVLEGMESLDQLVTELIRSQFQFFMDNQEFFQLAISEQGKILQSSNTGLREALIKKQNQHMTMTTQAIQKHLPENSPIKATTLALSITGAVNFHTLGWMLSPGEIDLETLTAEMSQLFLQGVK